MTQTKWQRGLSGVVAYILLLVLSSVVLGIFLWNSHQREWKLAESRLEFSAALISEWISSAFVASDYLLRDMAELITPEDLVYPHPDPESQADLNRRLEQRRLTFPYAFLHGAFDRDCIVTHGNAVLGFDASEREYCQTLQATPGMDSHVTHGYPSNVGPVNVTHARALRDANGELSGMVAIALDTEFFTQWLVRMGTMEVETLAIIDHQQMLLARYPALPQAVGNVVNSHAVRDFLASKDVFRVFFLASPLDGKPRYFGARKIAELPFIIVVGMDPATWHSGWYRLLGLGLFGWLLIAILGLLALRNYLRLLDGRVELQHQARTDSLTGIANRLHFTELAEREVARAQRSAGWISLLLLDIDQFKIINDTHGHLTGDRAIQAFATCCKTVTRAEDIVGRWGGDEFVVLIAQDPTSATQLAERLLESIRAFIIHDDEGQLVRLDASIGIVCKQADQPLELDELVRQADQAMLQAKKSGRGRISRFG